MLNPYNHRVITILVLLLILTSEETGSHFWCTWFESQSCIGV